MMRQVSLVDHTATPQTYTFPYTTLFRSCNGSTRSNEMRPRAVRCELIDLTWLTPTVIGVRARADDRRSQPGRSEEHTSELQSQSNLVCRLLLEKKNRTGRSRQLPRR